MANVFVFSSDEATTRTSYGSTAAKINCELDLVLPLIQERDAIELLRNAYPDGRCYLWGAQEGKENLSNWDVMTAEDLVLGFQNNSVVSASFVLMKLHAPALAAQIWSNGAEAPFGLMCFMDKPHIGKVTIVPQMLRYLDGSCRGFTKLAMEKRNNILSDFGSFEAFVSLCLGFDFPFSLRHSE